MKVIMYLLPLFEDGLIGPQRSECTSSKTSFALHEFPLENGLQSYLLTTQSSHTFDELSNFGIPSTIFFWCRVCKPPKLRCAYQKCQSQATSFDLVKKQEETCLGR